MNPWAVAVLAWIGVIFFSSTSIASDWSEAAFQFISGIFFPHLGAQDDSYGLLHLVADKGFHVALFCVLAVLLWNLLSTPRWKKSRILLAGAVVGSCSEFLQRFFPGRDPAIRDVLINVAGTAVGMAAMLIIARRRSRTQEEASCLQSVRPAS
jgi:VanZ family protein